MLLFILKNAIISIILIFLLHYIYDYFKTNLTTPKVKDLVNKPHVQYEEIISCIKEGNNVVKMNKKEDIEKEKVNMKDELKKYMEDLNDDDSQLQDISNTNFYETY
jgi:hypothetical protein